MKISRIIGNRSEPVKQDIIRLFQHFLVFLHRPYRQVDEAPLSAYKAVFFLLITNAVFAGVIVLPLVYFLDKYIIPLRMPQEYLLFSWPVVLFLIVVFAPIVEELLFRYPLKFAYNLSVPFPKNKPLNCKLAIYFSSIGFGLVHLTNYTNTEPLFFILAPAIISSQLMGGFIMAYLRVQYGVGWSMLKHALFNGMAVFFSYCFYHNIQCLELRENSLNLSVREYMLADRSNHYIRIYRSGLGIDSMVIRQMDLQQVLDSIRPGLYVNNTIVDIDFYSENTIHPDSVVQLLRKEYSILDEE